MQLFTWSSIQDSSPNVITIIYIAQVSIIYAEENVYTLNELHQEF